MWSIVIWIWLQHPLPLLAFKRYSRYIWYCFAYNAARLNVFILITSSSLLRIDEVYKLYKFTWSCQLNYPFWDCLSQKKWLRKPSAWSGRRWICHCVDPTTRLNFFNFVNTFNVKPICLSTPHKSQNSNKLKLQYFKKKPRVMLVECAPYSIFEKIEGFLATLTHLSHQISLFENLCTIHNYFYCFKVLFIVFYVMCDLYKKL